MCICVCICNCDNCDKLVNKTEELVFVKLDRLSLHQILFSCNSGGEMSSYPFLKFLQHSAHPPQMGIHLLKGELAAKTIVSSVGCVSSGDRIIANTPSVLRYLNSLPGNVKNVRCAWLWNITIQWLSHLKSNRMFSSCSHHSVRVWYHSEHLFLEAKIFLPPSLPLQNIPLHTRWGLLFEASTLHCLLPPQTCWESQTQKAVQH